MIFSQFQMQDGAQVVQPQAIQAGGQVIQLGTPTVSVASAVQQTASTTSTTATSGNSAGNQNIIMMVPGATGGTPTIQRIPLPGKVLTYLQHIHIVEIKHEYYI